MPRPKKCRRVCALPKQGIFMPLEAEDKMSCVALTVDEYEAIRIIDFLEGTQENCAARMGVSRTTVQAVYHRARKKLADAIVNGKRLLIQGGDYKLCPHSGVCEQRDGKQCCACHIACEKE